MGNWSPTVVIDPIEFDGDNIIFTLERMEVSDFLKLSKNMSFESGKELKLTFVESMDVCVSATELFPKYVKNISGMTSKDGLSVTLEKFTTELVNQTYFLNLIGQLLGELMTISVVNEVEEGNLDKP